MAGTPRESEMPDAGEEIKYPKFDMTDDEKKVWRFIWRFIKKNALVGFVGERDQLLATLATKQLTAALNQDSAFPDEWNNATIRLAADLLGNLGLSPKGRRSLLRPAAAVTNSKDAKDRNEYEED